MMSAKNRCNYERNCSLKFTIQILRSSISRSFIIHFYQSFAEPDGYNQGHWVQRLYYKWQEKDIFDCDSVQTKACTLSACSSLSVKTQFIFHISSEFSE